MAVPANITALLQLQGFVTVIVITQQNLLVNLNTKVRASLVIWAANDSTAVQQSESVPHWLCKAVHVFHNHQPTNVTTAPSITRHPIIEWSNLSSDCRVTHPSRLPTAGVTMKQLLYCEYSADSTVHIAMYAVFAGWLTILPSLQIC